MVTVPERRYTLLNWMKRARFVAIAATLAPLAAVSCSAPDPEIVAIAYVRATNTGDGDAALRLLDMDEILRRVDEQIVIVRDGDAESFLEQSVETLLWGLYRESRQAEYSYDAQPADIEGDMARVTVTKVDPDQEQTETVVHLRNTSQGWRVSGESLDPLVNYVVQRLEERY
jgi:hypothetical protein